MAKKKKINESELATLQEVVKLMTDIKTSIGGLELEKTNLLLQYEAVNKELDKSREALKESYGDINVNLSTGEYEVIKEE
jgi:hypothetical protein